MYNLHKMHGVSLPKLLIYEFMLNFTRFSGDEAAHSFSTVVPGTNEVDLQMQGSCL